MVHQLGKTNYALQMASKEDGALDPIVRGVAEVRKALEKLVSGRALAEAQRKDARVPERERECWSLYFPRTYAWEVQQFKLRTQHTMTHRYSCLSREEDVRPSDPTLAWFDLEYALNHQPPPDIAKMAAHHEEMRRQCREFNSREAA